jgi:hypothetical protein
VEHWLVGCAHFWSYGKFVIWWNFIENILDFWMIALYTSCMISCVIRDALIFLR